MRQAISGATVFATVLVSASASAQTTDVGQPSPVAPRSWYVALGTTLGAVNDPVAEDIYRADLGLEVGGGISVGRTIGRIRLEAQLSYENFVLNNLNPFPGSPITATDTVGDLYGAGMMGNVVYELGAQEGIRPFVGIGGGFLHLKADYREIGCALCFTGGPLVVGGSDTVAAGQAMAGLAFPLGGGSGSNLIGYRFLKTDEIRLEVVGAGPVTQDGVTSHSFLVGFLFRLPP